MFRLREHGTTFWTEVRGGLVTFLTLSYILFVQPAVLSVAGMPGERPSRPRRPVHLSFHRPVRGSGAPDGFLSGRASGRAGGEGFVRVCGRGIGR